MTWLPVLGADELPARTPTAVEVAGRPLCLVRLDDAVHAFDDACPHRRWPLHEGRLAGNVLTCRAHTWEWDVRTGELLRMRAPECLVTHEARERDGVVEVRVDPEAPAAAERSALWARARARAAQESTA
ncbi:MAG: Rieske 2Fe-2S domain-containing protein [Actinomycetota bacterium]|nr:Rieske 2Fe-2S domain-containing protein [Actinomycetota bacterium]